MGVGSGLGLLGGGRECLKAEEPEPGFLEEQEASPGTC